MRQCLGQAGSKRPIPTLLASAGLGFRVDSCRPLITKNALLSRALTRSANLINRLFFRLSTLPVRLLSLLYGTHAAAWSLVASIAPIMMATSPAVSALDAARA